MPEAVATKSEQGTKAGGKARGPMEARPTTRSTSPVSDILRLQSTAGNQVTSELLTSRDPAIRSVFGIDRFRTVPLVVHEAIEGDGQALESEVRDEMEQRFDRDLSGVRIHTDANAAESADAVNALAYTVGNDIVFGPGEYAPDTESGRRLLSHELTHTIQQTQSFGPIGSGQRFNLESEANKAADHPGESPMPRLSAAPISLQRQPKKSGSDDVSNLGPIFQIYPFDQVPDEAEIRKQLIGHGFNDAQTLGESRAVSDGQDAWSFVHPKYGEIAHVSVGQDSEGGRKFYTLKGYSVGPIAKANSKGAQGAGAAGTEQQGSGQQGSGQQGSGQQGSGQQGSSQQAQQAAGGGGQTSQPGGLTPEERQRLDAIRELMTGSKQKTNEDPKELLRLYQALRDAVEDPTFSRDKGDPWTKFAKFLANNKDKIEGILKGKPPGELTQEKLEKIIAEYGKFIVGQPDEQPEKLEKVEDYDKLLKYNPNWQKMSPADRKLLLEYAKMTPEELEKAPIDFSVVTTDMKVGMALKLSKSWPAAVGDAAKNAFTDPSFVIMLIVTIGIYVGLWMTPDPSFVTKLAAGTLTVVMLAQFAWQDIYGTAKAWLALETACARATTIKDLQTAGDVFAAQVGAVGFDILLFIAMWGLGKAAGPKLSKIGAKRGVARAEAGVKAAEAKPGSGVQQPATGEAAKILDKAARPTASATLDALADLLPDDAAKTGLKQLRQIPGGDMQALRALKAELAKGIDLGRFLSEKVQPAEVRAQSRAALMEARSKLARAKLIEADTIKDPALREAARTEQLNAIKEILQKAGVLDDPKIQKAMQAGDTGKLVGELGEAIQRTQMRAKYPASQGYSVLSNVEIVQEVPGFDSIAKWSAAEKAAGREGNPRGLYEQGNKLWKSVGNADSLVAKSGPGNKLQPVEIEEVKTGGQDSPTQAERQVAKVTTGLGQIAAGQKGVRIFDRIGKNQLGSDLTDQFDLSQINTVKTSTRGPEGKGYAQSLGFDTSTLSAVAESLVKNLPPAKLPVIPPVVSPRKLEEKKKEEESEDQLVPAGR
jgi:hypothetical protein